MQAIVTLHVIHADNTTISTAQCDSAISTSNIWNTTKQKNISM